MRVVVAGAGFAGLAAADRITRSGQQAVVLEARDRVGGRVWSQRLIPDDERTVIERGAEFVLDGYDVMRSLLSRNRASGGEAVECGKQPLPLDRTASVP